MILWEMATMTKPFEMMGREQFLKEVVSFRCYLRRSCHVGPRFRKFLFDTMLSLFSWFFFVCPPFRGMFVEYAKKKRVTFVVTGGEIGMTSKKKTYLSGEDDVR